MKFQVISKELLTKKSHRVATKCDDFQELKSSINESGIKYPLLVNKKGKNYEVVDGRRRLRACTELSWDDRIKIPVIIVKFKKTKDTAKAIIKEIDAKRLDHHCQSELANLLCNNYDLDVEEVAEHFSLSSVSVCEMLRTFDLPEPTLKALRGKKISVDSSAIINEKMDYHDLCLVL